MPTLPSVKLSYLDYCATTPCFREVVEAMSIYWNDKFGNPSSSHVFGRIAKSAIEKARSQVAMLLNCEPAEIIFTSGATESNNLLFLGLLLDQHEKRKRIVVSSIEHKSVLEPARFLATRGFELAFLPVSSGGIVDLDAARKLINNDTALVSVHAANNEIGTIQPIKELAEIAHSVGASFHTDATQALGKIPFDVQDIDCDLASFSAHKCYGPKGIGALYVRGGIKRWKWEFPFHGGGQENGLRPGTHNVAAIVGFGEACRIIHRDFTNIVTHLDLLRSAFEEQLKLNSSYFIHCADSPRIAGVSCIYNDTTPSDLIIDNIASMALSRASACNAGTISPSHVIMAIGCNSQVADKTLRVSFGINTIIGDVTSLCDGLINALTGIQYNKTERRV